MVQTRRNAKTVHWNVHNSEKCLVIHVQILIIVHHDHDPATTVMRRYSPMSTFEPMYTSCLLCVGELSQLHVLCLLLRVCRSWGSNMIIVHHDPTTTVLRWYSPMPPTFEPMYMPWLLCVELSLLQVLRFVLLRVCHSCCSHPPTPNSTCTRTNVSTNITSALKFRGPS